MGPDVRAVVRQIDRDVAHDGDAAAVGGALDAVPLSEEKKLPIGLERDRLGKVRRRRLAVPRRPGAPTKMPLEDRKARPIGEPVRLLRRRREDVERLPLRRIGVLAEMIPGFPQDPLLPGDDRCEVDVVGRKDRRALERRFGEEPLTEKQLRRNQEGIPCKRRGGAVGRVPMARRTERQHLPERLPRRRRPVEKEIGLRAEVADPETPGKRRRVKKDAGVPPDFGFRLKRHRLAGHDTRSVPAYVAPRAAMRSSCDR